MAKYQSHEHKWHVIAGLGHCFLIFSILIRFYSACGLIALGRSGQITNWNWFFVIRCRLEPTTACAWGKSKTETRHFYTSPTTTAKSRGVWISLFLKNKLTHFVIVSILMETSKPVLAMEWRKSRVHTERTSLFYAIVGCDAGTSLKTQIPYSMHRVHCTITLNANVWVWAQPMKGMKGEKLDSKLKEQLMLM